jgi:hypothetical protein
MNHEDALQVFSQYPGWSNAISWLLLKQPRSRGEKQLTTVYSHGCPKGER